MSRGIFSTICRNGSGQAIRQGRALSYTAKSPGFRTVSNQSCVIMTRPRTARLTTKSSPQDRRIPSAERMTACGSELTVAIRSRSRLCAVISPRNPVREGPLRSTSSAKNVAQTTSRQ
jgi:hypothetical protein